MRLKPKPFEYIRLNGRHFNTKKVRLKPHLPRPQAVEHLLFQYQKGAIKTTWLDNTCLVYIHFNTKKVRLKHFERRAHAAQVEQFQYQKGAIKTEKGRGLRVQHVRFQYQKGAIKTEASTTRHIQCVSISIPKRCD